MFDPPEGGFWVGLEAALSGQGGSRLACEAIEKTLVRDWPEALVVLNEVCEAAGIVWVAEFTRTTRHHFACCPRRAVFIAAPKVVKDTHIQAYQAIAIIGGGLD